MKHGVDSIRRAHTIAGGAQIGAGGWAPPHFNHWLYAAVFYETWTVHRARQTVEVLCRETPEFTASDV